MASDGAEETSTRDLYSLNSENSRRASIEILSPFLSVMKGLGPNRSGARRPRMIANFAVTYRCNSRCRTCNIWRIPEGGHDELSLGEIHAVFDANHDFLRNVESIQITGGEPFLRRDLPAIISTINEHLPRCTFWIPTNGMDTETVEGATREMLNILGGRRLGISVSIDGVGATHDEMRGVEGSYRDTVSTLSKLADLRKANPGLGLTVGMTLTSDNYRNLWDVFKLARRFDAEFSFRPVNFSDIYYRNMGRCFDLREAIEELTPVVRAIGRDLVKRRGIVGSTTSLYYMEGALKYIRSPENSRLRCSAGSDSLFMDPMGNVYPCIIMDLKMGNVRESPLDEIWGSREAWEARRRIREGLCPGCWVECETYRNIHSDLSGLLSTALRASFNRFP